MWIGECCGCCVSCIHVWDLRPICNAIQPRKITVRFAAMEIFFECLLFIFSFLPCRRIAFCLCVFYFFSLHFLSFDRMENLNSTKISTFFFIHKLKLILFVCVSFDFPLFKNCAWLTFPLAVLFVCVFLFRSDEETWQRYDKEQKMKMQFSWWVFNILKRHKLYLFAIHKCFCFSTFDFSLLSAYFFMQIARSFHFSQHDSDKKRIGESQKKEEKQRANDFTQHAGRKAPGREHKALSR